MYKFFRSFIFLLIICLLDNNVLYIKSGLFIGHVHASEDTTKERQDAGYEKYRTSNTATNPLCLGGVIIALTTLAISIGLLTGGKYGVIAGVIMLTISMLVQAMAYSCLYSFVKNPVMRGPDGNYKTCAEIVQPLIPNNPESPKICPGGNYKTCATKSTSKITNEKNKPSECEYDWGNNGAPHSQYIEFCYRSALGGTCIPNERNGQCLDGLDTREQEFSKWPGLLNAKKRIGGTLKCATLKNGESTTLHAIKFEARYKGGNICVYNLGIGELPMFPQSEIGCHLRDPSPPPPMCEKSVKQSDGSWDNAPCFNCYIASACYGATSGFSHAKLPMTSTVVECVRESLSNILNGNCIDPSTGRKKEGFLTVVQKRLRSAVQAVLVLAIILFGFKLMLGAVQGLQEWGMLIIKVALVAYFAIGGGMQLYYDQLIKLSIGVADIVQSAGGKQDICRFEPNDYKYLAKKLKSNPFTASEQKCYSDISAKHINDISAANTFATNNCSLTDLSSFVDKLYTKDFAYISIWDRLDCRMSFYFGQSIASAGSVAAGAIVGAALPIFGIILGLLFSGQILVAIIVFIFIFVMILTMLWMAQIFIISMIILAVLALFAPIFVPMCLFQVTKNFFDSWIKELITYSLYPVVLFGFLSLVFSVFDTLFFTAYNPGEGVSKSELTFSRVISPDKSRSVFNFYLDPSNQCEQSEKKNILACLITTINFVTKPLIFGINVTEVRIEETELFLQRIGMMALMGFLFWHFLGIIGSLAAELAGNFRGDLSQQSMNPQAAAKKALATAIRVGKAVATKGKSEVDRAKRKVLEKGKEMAKGGSDKNKDENQSADRELSEEAGGATGGGEGSGGGGAGGGGAGGGGGAA